MTYRFATLNDLLAVLHGIPDRTAVLAIQDQGDAVTRAVVEVHYEPHDETNTGATVWLVTEEV